MINTITKGCVKYKGMRTQMRYIKFFPVGVGGKKLKYHKKIVSFELEQLFY